MQVVVLVTAQQTSTKQTQVVIKSKRNKLSKTEQHQQHEQR